LRREYFSDSFSQIPENFVDLHVAYCVQDTKAQRRRSQWKTRVSKEYRNGM